MLDSLCRESEPVPLRTIVCQRKAFARTSPFSEEIRLSFSARTTLENWGKSLASCAQQSEHPGEPLRLRRFRSNGTREIG